MTHGAKPVELSCLSRCRLFDGVDADQASWGACIVVRRDATPASICAQTRFVRATDEHAGSWQPHLEARRSMTTRRRVRACCRLLARSKV